MAMNSDYSCDSNLCLLRHVLVAMQKESRLSTVNVSDECLKAKMDIIFPVVNMAR